MKRNLTIIWNDVIDSTNSEALRRAAEVESGTVWSADFQTAGRGQRGNKWLSTKALNLTYTILVKPEFLKIEQQFVISMISALSVYKYLQKRGLDPKIKWPNDVYVNDCKICGMLIENILSYDSLSVCAIGIGVNINQLQFDPALLNPTSLLNEVRKIGYPHKEFDRHEELELLLDEFFTLYELIKTKSGRDEVSLMFINAMYRRGEWFSYEEIDNSTDLNHPVETIAGSRTVEGKILGIDDEFNLLLEHRNGTVKHYAFKEIKYIL